MEGNLIITSSLRGAQRRGNLVKGEIASYVHENINVFAMTEGQPFLFLKKI